MLTLVAAMAHDRVIGKSGTMPWHLPAELKHFKTVTLGKPVIMGRTTFDSLPGPLPKRQNIVVSRQSHLAITGVTVCRSIDDAIALTKPTEDVIIMGGASLYEQTIDRADRMILTLIDLKTPGDTYFTIWNEADWICLNETSHPISDTNTTAFRCIWLERSSES